MTATAAALARRGGRLPRRTMEATCRWSAAQASAVSRARLDIERSSREPAQAYRRHRLGLALELELAARLVERIVRMRIRRRAVRALAEARPVLLRRDAALRDLELVAPIQRRRGDEA